MNRRGTEVHSLELLEEKAFACELIGPQEYVPKNLQPNGKRPTGEPEPEPEPRDVRP